MTGDKINNVVLVHGGFVDGSGWQGVYSILKRKADHSIADEFFHDILDEHFSEEEVQRQFETAMNWGRYAEIFDYDRASGRLVQTEPPQAEASGSPPAPTAESQDSVTKS